MSKTSLARIACELGAARVLVAEKMIAGGLRISNDDVVLGLRSAAVVRACLQIDGKLSFLLLHLALAAWLFIRLRAFGRRAA